MSDRIALRRGQVPKARPQPKRRAAPEARMRVPVGPRRLKGWVVNLAGGVAAIGAAAALWLGGAPQSIWADVAQRTAGSGFEVRHVEIAGLHELPRMAVYRAAVEGPTDSMLGLSLDTVRDRLRALPWVADASVSRRLPDTLVVNVVERRPMALWQFRHKLSVIDRDGHVLDTRHLERFAALPLIVGSQANVEAHPLMVMLADHPEIRQHLDSAIWIGARRWDIRLKSGETLALPEGYGQASRALTAFARMDEQSGLLGKGFARFDMRLPDRLTVRVSGEPGVQAQAKGGVEI